MIARRLSVLGVICSLVLPGCVIEKRDFETLRDQVRLQQRQIQDLKARQEELALRGDALNNGFKILGDKAGENARRIDDLEGRDSAPAPQPAPPPATAPAPAPALAPAPRETTGLVAAPIPAEPEGPILLTNLPKPVETEPPPEEIITAGPKPEKLYAGALALYSGRDYQQAIARFEEFVAGYPEHKLAGNAQYWIGECYYSQRRFVEAAAEFAKVETDFPESHKIPAALFKKGLSLAELNRMPEAETALQRILERHGQSEEAAKARERLERWRRP